MPPDRLGRGEWVAVEDIRPEHCAPYERAVTDSADPDTTWFGLKSVVPRDDGVTFLVTVVLGEGDRAWTSVFARGQRLFISEPFRV